MALNAGGIRIWFQKWISSLILAFIVSYLLLPLPWLVLASFDATAESYYSTLEFTINNYLRVVFDSYIIAAFVNSLIISVLTAALTTTICFFAGYSLSRSKMAYKNKILSGLLLLMVLPFTALMVPIYTFCLLLGITNSYMAVIMVISSFETPFCTWIMKGHVDNVSTELEESAWIDGCSHFESLRKIVLPLSVRGLTVVALISFVAAWNEFLIPFILLSDSSYFPVSVILSNFVIRGGTQHGILEYSIGDLAAFSVLYTLPALLATLLMRKSLLKVLGRGIRM